MANFWYKFYISANPDLSSLNNFLIQKYLEENSFG